MTEISLMRVFDVLFYPNIAYLIITCSLFAFGLAGVYSVLKPLSQERNPRVEAAKWSALLSIAVFAILPVMNFLPFNFNELAKKPVWQIIYFAGMYLSLAAPFFLTGLILITLFAESPKRIQVLYFWDLAGAALGSILVIPLIPLIGPGGLLFYAAAICLIASALFMERKSWSAISAAISLLLLFIPIAYSPRYFDFKEHQGKRGVKYARLQGKIEETIWDPISKIDVINDDNVRSIAYDGGSQTSLFYPFDGDFQALREKLPLELNQHFWQRGVLVSHYLKEGSSPKVLIIGSAGGQEIKAALMYGAGNVDAVEMVGSVVKLGETKYSTYIGNLFHNPLVTVFTGEGRSFLRATQDKYDIIQIFSNHTSSSIAAGTGAVATNYLQTADAYREYFSHLSDNGILHINHFYYPKMVTTAALAWKQMGRKDFQRNVIVYEYDQDETLPTFLIKMEPWTDKELRKVKGFFSSKYPGDNAIYSIAIDPLDRENNTIPVEYFSGALSSEAVNKAETRIQPATDNRPYFNFLQKSFNPFPKGIKQFLKDPTGNLPIGLATLYLSGVVGLFYAAIFIVVPLTRSNVGRQKWPNKGLSLIYFACLGAGFIIIEFVFIQRFMRLIGSPLYTYSTVLFVLLLSAGIGSLTSSRLRITPRQRWFWPYIGIFLSMIFLLFFSSPVTGFFLAAPVPARVLVAFLFMFPIGFFLGMFFPLGILFLEHQPKGAIAWAWGLNGLFTVIGGLLAVIFSIQWGFDVTLLIACALYGLTFLILARIRSTLKTMDSPNLIDNVTLYWDNHIHDLAITTHPVGSPEFFQELEVYRYEKLHYLPRLIDFSANKGKTLLEVGCGAGIDLARFAQAGAVVTGIDLSSTAIGLARQNIQHKGLKADLCVMNGEALDFPADTFDVVYAHGVLQYTSDAKKMISEIHRVLKPGGEAILMVYNKISWLNLLSKWTNVPLEHADAPVLNQYSSKEFRQSLSLFTRCRIVPERFPVKTKLHSGWKAKFYNGIFINTFNHIPKRLVRPLGWHLMAFAFK